jgi:histidinol dehydrogenase
MRVIRYPKREDWSSLLARPSVNDDRLAELVRSIIGTVRTRGDAALRHLTAAFDETCIEQLAVTREEFVNAERRLPDELKRAIDVAKTNIEKFHRVLPGEVEPIETSPGVLCWKKSVPIERVGLYVPSGTAPLFSTVLMLGIPAKLAGCSEIVICSPPDRDGSVAEVILYTAKLCGIEKVFKVGGAQAIAAMAYGTETIPKVDKIFGPGNSYVTLAKQLVSTNVAIDMPAGPSEVAVLADSTCVPAFVAADLLSQAEHGRDSQVVLVSADEQVIDATLAEVEKQIATLPRCEIAKASIGNSVAVLVETIDDGSDLLNEYAPEHLILAVADPESVACKVKNAGSVFLGNYSCESAGDYASGTNHTLPTGGFARSYSGVSVESFLKTITFQRLTETGIRNIGPSVEVMAEAEGLQAHKRAMSIRLEAIDGI